MKLHKHKRLISTILAVVLVAAMIVPTIVNIFM